MFSMKFDKNERSRMANPLLRNRPEETPTCSTDLDSLHSKLQLEADKFVRWKVSTEVNLNQKERQLHGSQETIKVLKDNLLQSQLAKETLSLTLERERTNKKLINAKVSATRQLVQFTQQQHDQLSLSVQEFAELRHRLSANQDQNLSAISGLCIDFQQLELNISEFMETTYENVKSELAQMKLSKLSIEQDLKNEHKLKEQLDVQVLNREEEIKTIANKAVELEEQNNHALEELKQLREFNCSLNADFQSAQQDLQLSSNNLIEAMSRAKESEDSFNQEIITLKEESQELRIMLANSKEEMQKIITENLEQKELAAIETENKVQNMNCDLNKLEGTITEMISAHEVTVNELQAKTNANAMHRKKAFVNRRKLCAANRKTAVLEEQISQEKAASSAVRDEMELRVEAEKQLSSDLLCKCETKEDELKELKSQLADVEELKNRAFEEAGRNKELCINVQLESENKIKEMVNMLDDYKLENENNLRAKEGVIDDMRKDLDEVRTSLERSNTQKDTLKEENIQLMSKLAEKTANHAVFKNVIQTLSAAQSPGNSPTDALKTPSPSVYLSLCRPASALRTQFAPTRRLTPKLASIDEETRGNNLKLKRVSFKSPIFDSDSSDFNALEVGSETDDKFDSLRSNNKRNIRITRSNLPQAKVQPLTPYNSRDSNRKASNKKARLDKGELKTYSIPLWGKNIDENKPPMKGYDIEEGKKKGEVSFQKVVKFQ